MFRKISGAVIAFFLASFGGAHALTVDAMLDGPAQVTAGDASGFTLNLTMTPDATPTVIPGTATLIYQQWDYITIDLLIDRNFAGETPQSTSVQLNWLPRPNNSTPDPFDLLDMDYAHMFDVIFPSAGVYDLTVSGTVTLIDNRRVSERVVACTWNWAYRADGSRYCPGTTFFSRVWVDRTYTVGTATFDVFRDVTVEPSPVPLPAPALLLLAGLGGLAAFGRRRRLR